MATIVRGKNICLTPSALIMGKIMPEALCERAKYIKDKFFYATLCIVEAILFLRTGKTTYRNYPSSKPKAFN